MAIYVTYSSMPTIDEYFNEIRCVWDTHILTNMGEKHQALQRELCNFLGVDKLELFTNGHMALELALQALDLSGEVITTPFTFVSTTHAIVRNGLKPVFCDIDPIDFTIDVTKIESLITDRTCAILPVHVYGNICNVEEIGRLAKKYGLKVIYDAAHSFGVKYKGESAAAFGDVSCFSFHATKVFNTIEGGMACFQDDELAGKLKDLKNFGIHNAESVEAVGANAKMNEFCAAMGICNLRHLSEEIAKRKLVVERYRSLLDGIPGIQLNPVQKDVESNYAYFPIVVDEKVYGATRNEIAARLAENGIYARKYFYPLTNACGCYKSLYNVEDTPVALHISNRVLTLPLYGGLELEEAERISRIIRMEGK